MLRSGVFAFVLFLTAAAQAVDKVDTDKCNFGLAHVQKPRAYHFKMGDVKPYIEQIKAARNPLGKPLEVFQRIGLIEAGYKLFVATYAANLDAERAQEFLKEFDKPQSLFTKIEFLKSDFPETTPEEISQLTQLANESAIDFINSTKP
jgi:hypothetical protein